LLRLCGIIAPGFSEVFASAKALGQTRGDTHDCAFGTTYDTWFSNVKLFHQLIEANPIITLALTAPIEIFPQRPDGIKIERIETGQVAINTKVIVVPAQFRVQCFELVWHVLTHKQAYRHFSEERIAYKYLTWGWQLDEEARGGLTRQQFARYYLMRLGIGHDLKRIALNPKYPRKLASEAEVLALKPELNQTR